MNTETQTNNTEAEAAVNSDDVITLTGANINLAVGMLRSAIPTMTRDQAYNKTFFTLGAMVALEALRRAGGITDQVASEDGDAFGEEFLQGFAAVMRDNCDCVFCRAQKNCDCVFCRAQKVVADLGATSQADRDEMFREIMARLGTTDTEDKGNED